MVSAPRRADEHTFLPPVAARPGHGARVDARVGAGRLDDLSPRPVAHRQRHDRAGGHQCEQRLERERERPDLRRAADRGQHGPRRHRAEQCLRARRCHRRGSLVEHLTRDTGYPVNPAVRQHQSGRRHHGHARGRYGDQPHVRGRHPGAAERPLRALRDQHQQRRDGMARDGVAVGQSDLPGSAQRPGPGQRPRLHSLWRQVGRLRHLQRDGGRGIGQRPRIPGELCPARRTRGRHLGAERFRGGWLRECLRHHRQHDLRQHLQSLRLR